MSGKLKLTVAQKHKLFHSLTPSQKSVLKNHMCACHQSGEGIGSFFKKLGSVLAPIAKEIGPTVLREILIPIAKKKVGLGLKTAGSGTRTSGGALSLAGGKRKPRKKA